MLKLQEGQYVSITGAEVKGENDIYIVGHDYNVEGKYAVCKNEYCLYKVKLNGERYKIKYSIVFYNARYEKQNENLNIKIVTDLKKAKKEVNSYLKARENNEIVTTFKISESQKAVNGSILRFKDYFKFGIFGEKHIGKGMLYEITFRDDKSCYIKELGKSGQSISNGRYFGCTPKLTESILEATEVIEKVETLKGQIQKDAEKVISKEEVIEVENLNESEEVKSEESKEETTQERLNYTISEDTHTKTGEKLFVISFDKRFSKEEFKIVLEQIKNIGGYYSKFKKGFIFKDDPTEKISSVGLQENQVDNMNRELEEIENIDIENINEENFPIDKSISKRENDGHWVFRTKERSHQQEIINCLTNYQEEFKKVLGIIEDVRIINKYSRWLNSFKKKYYNNYYSRLKNDANNPSWAVTGRAGRNSNKDRKHMTRHDNLMRELISLEDEYREKLSSLKGEIKRIEREKFNSNVENNNMEYEFKRVKKEYDLSAVNDYFKFPTGSYNAYEGSNGQETVYIIKSWGAWCVVNSDGMEFKDSRSKTIADAKKKANYYLSQSLIVA